jgi:hypothetical protein
MQTRAKELQTRQREIGQFSLCTCAFEKKRKIAQNRFLKL